MRRKQRLLVMFAMLCGSAACGSNATPAGSTIVKWQLAESDRVPIRTGLVDDMRTFEREVVAHPTPETAVRLRVRVEAAKVTWHEGTETETHYAPIAVSARVVDNGGYRFRDVVCHGPAAEQLDGASHPETMFVRCRVTSTKPDAHVELRLRVSADGTVDEG